MFQRMSCCKFHPVTTRTGPIVNSHPMVATKHITYPQPCPFLSYKKKRLGAFYANHRSAGRNLRNRELETIQNFPRALVFDEGDIKELLACYADDTKDDDNAGAALYAKLVLRLEHMQNMFFLERLLLKKHSQPSTSLLTVSLDIISLTLDFWMYKSRLYDLHGDLDCLVSYSPIT